MNTGEIWRVVPSVPGLMASSLGRVCSEPYFIDMPHGGERSYKLSPTFGCAVRKNGKVLRTIFRFRGRTFKVHRIICEAFHGPPPSQSHVVMHLDEDGGNNVPENLAYGTQTENLNASGFIAYCKSRVGEESPSVKGRRKFAP